jgi:hypothetical protein
MKYLLEISLQIRGECYPNQAALFLTEKSGTSKKNSNSPALAVEV